MYMYMLWTVSRMYLLCVLFVNILLSDNIDCVPGNSYVPGNQSEARVSMCLEIIISS